jgi:hypothetical protein
MFNQLSGQWRKEQDRLLDDISFHQAADQAYLEEGARLLDLALGAQELLARQQPPRSGAC